MEYKKDLLKNNDKSIFLLILGIFFFVISIIGINERLANNEIMRVFDWFLFGILTLNGMIHIFAGLGSPIEGFLGKAFVRIDNEMIDIKLGAFEKEFKIDWNEIKSIECKSSNFMIQKLDNSSIFFPISKLPYSNIMSIKYIISKLATSKGIRYSIHED